MNNINEDKIDNLMQQIDTDRKEIILKEKEINRIKTQKLEKIDKEIEKEIVIKKNSNKKDCSEDFEKEVLFYYEKIEKLKDSDDLEDHLINLLPKGDNKNYKKLLLRFKMELLKSTKELRNLMLIDDSFSDEDIKEINKDINLNFKKIDIINNLNIKKKSINDGIPLENTLIFLRNDNNNVRILDDIKKMDIEYYDRVFELLKSIKDGTFKNPKNFTNNNNFAGISEVKLFQVRVIYDRIGYDKYVIIAIFVKKTDNNKGYREFISLRIKNYMDQKKLLKDIMNDDGFINENKIIEQYIYNILTGKEDKEGKIYEKQI